MHQDPPKLGQVVQTIYIKQCNHFPIWA